MNCTIEEEDKIQYDSYKLGYLYRGYSLEHQSSGKPLQIIEEGSYFGYDIQFLENTNIVFIDWKLIQYEEKLGVFSKTFQDMSGNKNTYWGGDIDSIHTYTDDGHVGALPDTL